MPHFIDRRLNPKDKSLGNRQRFLRRAREELKRSINDQIKSGKITDVDMEKSVPIPAKGTSEPGFQHAPGSGRKDYVLPGNKEFRAGDRIPKPVLGGGGSGKGSSPTGEAEDDFRFVCRARKSSTSFSRTLSFPTS